VERTIGTSMKSVGEVVCGRVKKEGEGEGG
jgi:hypothetical protein